MRHSLNFNLRPFAAYVAAITLAAICFDNATSAFAAPAETHAAPPPLPQKKPITSDYSAHLSPEPDKRHTARSKPAAKFGAMDEIATLLAIHQALSSVGDGGAYIWRRGNGRLTGLFRPTTSFKSSNGEICRHIIIRLNSKHYTREVEGIACRDESGTWSLSG